MAIYCLINSLHVHVITQYIDLRQKNGIYYLVNAKLKYLLRQILVLNIAEKLLAGL